MTEEEWNEKLRADHYTWMTDDQFECFLMLCDLVGGAHHLHGTVKQCGNGIEVSTRNHGFATFDYDLLTRAVVLGHGNRRVYAWGYRAMLNAVPENKG